VRSDPIAGPREAPLVEHAVGRQVDLAVQPDQLAISQQRGAVAEAVRIGLLDEADGQHHPGRLAAQRGEARVVRPHGDIRHQVGEHVAGQCELGTAGELSVQLCECGGVAYP